MEISKNPERKELEKKVHMFMLGSEQRATNDKIALFECTEYDKESDKHVFTGLELRLISPDYSYGEYTEICNVNDRTHYEIYGEYYDRSDIEKRIVDTVYRLLGEYEEYAKN